ncbi:hypothetical protein ANANG_G00228730 [Anguilla anguilla]|uniref:Uncharacterized protein n=1 Tax=Anguilla anguilla TaxID=7936 RepID=A0A9D3LZV3_ANGAN|nr:hypothetical protein ANANG_G00228730 [Anguilla anguilla]
MKGQHALKVLEKNRRSISLPLPKDDSHVVLEICAWGEGGNGPPHETIVSRDSGTGMMVQNSAGLLGLSHTLLCTAAVLLSLIGLGGL